MFARMETPSPCRRALAPWRRGRASCPVLAGFSVLGSGSARRRASGLKRRLTKLSGRSPCALLAMNSSAKASSRSQKGLPNSHPEL
ncbi:unnamed protein product, partial [Candidula unifasciata]